MKKSIKIRILRKRQSKLINYNAQKIANISYCHGDQYPDYV